ncbi:MULTISPECIES: ABC transporter permease [Devosia]|uniref:Dipeptide transport system permease protein DppB n=1 Tax=Devosia equisanguinis TaxID=2490941 RepID=A0A3S4GK64_9HYPH|nr:MULTISPECIES: ABC transporter permease [Devosia]ODT50162.1 MAG: ABC transporter permease [Pelagibacterium sp. SCN 63-126]ODU87373.1 MAG: ABC transporter permease [Pelagibacterium sp. SCN 63-17]OJX44905.1 MAG: ABC transporter permease [Devosia sp. 63-57]VDS06613.1 Dipeptide transport system permease protein DppB [Devosia equisanguinis]
MLAFIVRRLLLAIPMLIFISFISFVIIQLPPGDYVTAYVAQLAQGGEYISQAQQEAMRERMGLNDPMIVQYWRWITAIVFRGDFGYSLDWNAPVSSLIWDRLAITLALSTASLVITWLIAIPVGVYSATRQYSVLDYVFTVFGFLGKGTPDFLLALILMWIAFVYMQLDVGGLFSSQYQNAPWSWGKFIDLLQHLWIPLVVLGTGGAAGLIRVMRANMLDELGKPYVETAYAQGLSERQVVWGYPVRVALNPFISTVGWALPALFSGDVITAIVLNLPTTGPLLLQALKMQDMYLAGSFILILSVFTVIGTLISDILLAWFDPRIRYA